MDYQEAAHQIDLHNVRTDIMQYMVLVFIIMWVLYKVLKYLCQRDAKDKNV